VRPFVTSRLEHAPVAPTLRRSFSVVLATAILITAAISPAAAAPTRVRVSDAAAPGGRLIVLWRDQAPARIAIAGIDRVARTASGQRSVVVADPGQAGAVARALRSDPRVLAVVPDALVKASDWPADGIPNDPRYSQQPDLDQINVPESWPTTTGDPGVIVAVIDTGVDVRHRDLIGVSIVAPRNEIWNSTDVTDGLGHGTHVAGTIFARTNNAKGIAGIAPTSSLMPVKVLDDTGSGTFSDVIDGVDWARTHGADIINLSLGGTLYPEQVALIQPTFSAARAAGILVVAAAGNSGSPMIQYPAALHGVVSVGAVDGLDVLAEFSSFNRAVDISAPGVQTLSTIPGGNYMRASGTSMASPHVAGGAALVWSARPDLGVAELEAVLRTSAVDLGDPGRDNRFGSGRLDVLAALSAPVPSPLPELEPAPGITAPLVITFTRPTAPVIQTTSSFTVKWRSNHAVIDGLLVRQGWLLVDGACPDEFEWADDMVFLDLVSPTVDTDLSVGFCYRWTALGIDEESQVAEVTSAPVSVVDRTKPTITSSTPARSAVRISPTASVRITFSEPVTGVSATTLRLKNLRTGLWVRTSVRYSAVKQTATIDPVLAMYHGDRYRVYVLDGIEDLSGNNLATTSWWFRTR
jgi:subtilisin family serine protease